METESDKIITLAEGITASLIAALLIYFGTLLVKENVPNKNVLLFSFSENKVGKISSWHIKIENNSQIAFTVTLTPPEENLIEYDYSYENKNLPTWKGDIYKDQKLEVILIYKNSDKYLSKSLVEEIISSQYEERNQRTGGIETYSGKVIPKNDLTFPIEVYTFFWFMLPIALGVSLFLFYLLCKRKKINSKKSKKSHPK